MIACIVFSHFPFRLLFSLSTSCGFLFKKLIKISPFQYAKKNAANPYYLFKQRIFRLYFSWMTAAISTPAPAPLPLTKWQYLVYMFSGSHGWFVLCKVSFLLKMGYNASFFRKTKPLLANNEFLNKQLSIAYYRRLPILSCIFT